MPKGKLSLEQGTITAVHPSSRTYDVRAGGNGSTERTFTGCIWAAEAFGGVLGFKVDGVLSLGSPVLVLPGSPNAIVKALPYMRPDLASPKVRKVADGTPAEELYGDTHKPDHDLGFANHPYADLMEGEFAISNHLGVIIAFLTSMVKLGASDGAKIEMALHDDLVRVVSGTFRHHSAMGDEEIYDDGAPTSILEATSRTHEAAGVVGVEDPRGEVSKGAISSWSAETLRSRYTRYMGWLGDFVHEIVTDPAEALGTLAQERAGKSRFWRGEDGTVLLQSVAEISIEKVHRVVVPVRNKLPEDPEGNTAEEFASLPPEFLELWDYGPDYRDIADCAFQLRNYARWLSQTFCMARFHQLDKDWTVPSENASPEPSYGNGAPEVEAARENTRVMEVYSCLRIYRDGAVHLQSGRSWSLCCHGDDVYLSGAANLHVDMAGDIDMKSGGSVSLVVRKNIEIASTHGGVKVRGRTGLGLLSEDGLVHIKGDMVDTALGETPPANEDFDDLLPAETDPNGYGVIIEAPRSRVAVYGKDALDMSTEESPTEENPTLGRILLAARGGDVSVASGRDLALFSKEGTTLSAKGGLAAECRGDLLLDPTGSILFKKGRMALVPDGTLHIRSLLVGQLKCKFGLLARSVQAGTAKFKSATTFSGKTGKDEERPDMTPLDEATLDFGGEEWLEPLEEIPEHPVLSLSKDLSSWDMWPPSSWDTPGTFMQSPIQQLLANDLEGTDVDLFGTWSMSGNTLLGRDSRTGREYRQFGHAWRKWRKLDSPGTPQDKPSSASGLDLREKGVFSEANAVLRFRKPEP